MEPILHSASLVATSDNAKALTRIALKLLADLAPLACRVIHTYEHAVAFTNCMLQAQMSAALQLLKYCANNVGALACITDLLEVTQAILADRRRAESEMRVYSEMKAAHEKLDEVDRIKFHRYLEANRDVYTPFQEQYMEERRFSYGTSATSTSPSSSSVECAEEEEGPQLNQERTAYASHPRPHGRGAFDTAYQVPLDLSAAANREYRSPPTHQAEADVRASRVCTQKNPASSHSDYTPQRVPHSARRSV